MLCKFLSVYETRPGSTGKQSTRLLTTRRKDRGEERQTDSGFVARKRCDDKCKRVAIHVAFATEADKSGFCSPVTDLGWKVGPGGEIPGGLTWAAALRRLLPSLRVPLTHRVSLHPPSWPGIRRAGQNLPDCSGTYLSVAPVLSSTNSGDTAKQCIVYRLPTPWQATVLKENLSVDWLT